MNDEKKPAVTERPLDELVMCKYCGQVPELRNNQKYCWVECYNKDCAANPTTALAESAKLAVDLWNRSEFLGGT